MNHTRKAERQYMAKRDAIMHKINVLKAAEEYSRHALHCNTPGERDALMRQVCEGWVVTQDEVTLVLVLL